MDKEAKELLYASLELWLKKFQERRDSGDPDDKKFYSGAIHGITRAIMEVDKV